MTNQINHLIKLERKATKGPWKQTGSGFGGPAEGFDHYQLGACTFDRDAALIAELRNAAPHLIAVAKAARKRVKNGHNHFCPAASFLDCACTCGHNALSAALAQMPVAGHEN